jgi:ribose transport system permease protein
MSKYTVSRIFTDYGMLMILLLLCLFFSFVTYSKQSATGDTAAYQVKSIITQLIQKEKHILIVIRPQQDEIRYGETLLRELTNLGYQSIELIKGEPRDANLALQKLIKKGQKLDILACSQVTAGWLVFNDLTKDFPDLGNPPLIKPTEYYWPNFLKTDNLLNIANQIAVIAIVAIGMTMVIISGGIDLSVGSLIALSAVLSTKLIRDWGGGVHATPAMLILCCALAILICGLTGAFTGAMITKFGVPPFIVTLAMMLVGSGMAFILAEGQSIAVLPDSFIWLGRGADLYGLPNAVVLMFLLYLLAHLVMSRMTWGRYIYAVGGNSEAARLSGVPVQNVMVSSYIISALLAGLGGVILASQLKSGSATYGNMYELYVIAAVVVGGTSLNGGEGKMVGTLIGALTIAVIQNGMNLTNVESYTQKVVLGFVILGAVLLDKIRNRSNR